MDSLTMGNRIISARIVPDSLSWIINIPLARKGTGLGLNLVKELIDLNKGILNVSSKINEGSQFSVGLPSA